MRDWFRSSVHNQATPSLTISNSYLLAAAGLVGAVGIGLVLIVGFGNKQTATKWQDLQSAALGTHLSGPGPEQQITKQVPPVTPLPILLYHHVGAVPAGSDKLRSDLTVSPAAFEEQVAWLRGQGFHAVTLNEVRRYLKGEVSLPENPVVFTFDDGYDDVFQNAVPVLKKYGYVGSFAVITQFPGIEQGTNRYATWEQIRASEKLGMEIVSHTQNHFDGTAKDNPPAWKLANFKASSEDLKKNLREEPLPILVYPYGHYDAEYLQLARDAGFTFGITTRTSAAVRRDQPMEVPRLRVGGEQGIESFKKMVLDELAAARGEPRSK